VRHWGAWLDRLLAGTPAPARVAALLSVAMLAWGQGEIRSDPEAPGP
jgi:hypothetical protein